MCWFWGIIFNTLKFTSWFCGIIYDILKFTCWFWGIIYMIYRKSPVSDILKWKCFNVNLTLGTWYIIQQDCTSHSACKMFSTRAPFINSCLTDIRAWIINYIHCLVWDVITHPCMTSTWFISVNSSRPGQNGYRFADDIFRCIFVNEKFCILIKISLKFIPKGPIDNNPELVYIMAWRRIGDMLLSEPMLAKFTDAYMCH